MKAQPCDGPHTELFFQFRKRAGYRLRSSLHRKVVLTLDGKISHCRSLEAIHLARTAEVRMVSLPPHATQRLQPLSYSFGPLGKLYDEAIRKWMRSQVGRRVTTWQVAQMFDEAYNKAVSVSLAVSGFLASDNFMSVYLLILASLVHQLQLLFHPHAESETTSSVLAAEFPTSAFASGAAGSKTSVQFGMTAVVVDA